MAKKEAQARIKINKMLEKAGWRLLDGPDGPANVQSEAKNPLDGKDYVHLNIFMD